MRSGWFVALVGLTLSVIAVVALMIELSDGGVPDPEGQCHDFADCGVK
jgi:hypothetical protein